MKISIHSDVLVDLVDLIKNGRQGSSADALANVESEYWSPALSIAAAYTTTASRHGSEIAQELLQNILKDVGCVPLRSATLKDCAGHVNLEAASHISVNREIGVDAVLTRELLSEDVDGLPCISPEELGTHFADASFPQRVPFLDLKAQFSQIYNEIDDRFADIISNTAFILGPHVEEFESRFLELQESRYCVGLSSGTDALHVAFLALGIGPGDEVIVPANTFIATAEGVSLAGATPVFVDSNEYYNIDVDKARAVLEKHCDSGRVRAIAPVHLYGQPADMVGIAELAEEFDLAIVEDCAQAHLAECHGKKVGNVGHFGVFSHYPGKNLGAFGEAGSLVTNDEELYEKAKMIRAHGEATRYMHSVVGHNYRMEAMQGAVLATKAKYIAEWTAKRRNNARLYRELLGAVEEIQVPHEADFSKAVYHLFVIQTDERDKFRAYLEQSGIATGLHYPVPLHLQKAYASLGYHEGEFPVAENQAQRIVSLPMYPELAKRDIEYVCDTIKQYFSTSGRTTT